MCYGKFSCSVLTPYYTEEVLFSLGELEVQNEDGVSILFYLQKIFPGWLVIMRTLEVILFLLFFWYGFQVPFFVSGIKLFMQMNGTTFWRE